MEKISFNELEIIEKNVFSSTDSSKFDEIKNIKFAIQEEIKRFLTNKELLDIKCPLPNKDVINKLKYLGMKYYADKPTDERAYMIAQSIGIIICDYGWGTDYAVGYGLLDLINEIKKSYSIESDYHYIQCMKIAAHCSRMFGKIFKYELISDFPIEVKISPIDEEAGFYIIMEIKKDTNELFFRIFDTEFDDEYELDIEYLNNLANGLSEGFVEYYRFIKNGIVFILNDNFEYDFPYNEYTFLNKENKIETINNKCPLLDSIETDFELKSLLIEANENIDFSSTSIKKNDIPMFDISTFEKKNNTLIITIIKDNDKIDVHLKDNKFTENDTNTFCTMSLVSSLKSYGTKEANKKSGISVLYLTGRSMDWRDNSPVKIQHFCNCILTKEDFNKVIEILNTKFGFNPTKKWHDCKPCS